jgi:hypothetical protein
MLGGGGMEKGVFAEAVGRLFDSIGTLLIVIGAAMFAVGAAGGVKYNSFFPIDDLIGRAALLVGGAALVLIGIFIALRSNDPRKPHGIKITHPIKDQRVDTVAVQGSISKKLPKGFELWIVRIYPGHDSFLPLRKVNIEDGDQTWIAPQCDVGGKSGEDRALGAYLVGPATQEFFKYFKDAARVHNRWMDNLKVPKEAADRYLPNIERMTKDMIKCDRVDVKRL